MLSWKVKLKSNLILIIRKNIIDLKNYENQVKTQKIGSNLYIT